MGRLVWVSRHRRRRRGARRLAPVGRRRIVGEMRAIHHQRAAVAPELFAARNGTGRFTDGNRTNRRVRHFGDVLRINAVVDEIPAATVHVEIVDDRRVAENLRYLPRFNAMTPRMRVAEISRRHKREQAHAQAEIETDADRRAAVSEPDSAHEGGERRQRRPAAIIGRITPRHPRRPPNRVRIPAPAEARITEPASVVERRPAPRIIRHPIPAVIRINPVPVIAIRLPARIDHHHRRPPATAIAHPRPPRCHTARACRKNNSP